MFFFEKEVFNPLQRIEDTLLDARQVRLYVKRDDLLHPYVSGNKFRKLKYNLLEMKRLGKTGLITFGGAYSNHIHAVAAAGQLMGVPTIGIIRGEDPKDMSEDIPVRLNSTLQSAEQWGMYLHFISRTAYRNKDQIIKDLSDRYSDYYWLPEGGTNTLAMQGAAEVVDEIMAELGFQPDYICQAVGTGGTTAGIISAAVTLSKPIKVIGFAALKGDFLTKEVQQLLNIAQNEQTEIGTIKSNPVQPGILNYQFEPEISAFDSRLHWFIQNDYHFGGYAKWTTPLIDFINQFKIQHGISLDPIYTGKLFYGLFDMIEKGYFPKNTTIVAVHTGGLQGIEGFNARFGQLLDI
jgi:1-aminocyclopropane-1-carboxylate deaminase